MDRAAAVHAEDRSRGVNVFPDAAVQRHQDLRRHRQGDERAPLRSQIVAEVDRPVGYAKRAPLRPPRH